MNKRLLSLCLILLATTSSVFANEQSSSGTALVEELTKLISKYEGQLKYLQAENSVLRNEVSKAGIKIPLSEFSGSVLAPTEPTTATGGESSTGSTKKTPIKRVKTISGETEIALNEIERNHGKRYRGFIGGIIPNWTAIKNAYKLPPDAVLMGYEFVKKGDDNHVFVDISYLEGGVATATGVYDAKILYQYDTTTFARKLIGLFIYDKKLKYYITKTGNNPFAGVPRTFVAHPKISLEEKSSPAQATGTGTTNPPPVESEKSTVTLSEIEKAYTDKRYLSVITLSNNYLASNPATYDLLRIRYRTYFIIGKYAESLAEIEKITSLGRLDKAVACDAQVIATYGKQTALVTTYAKICKGN